MIGFDDYIINPNKPTVSLDTLRERVRFDVLSKQSTSRQIDPPKGKLLPSHGPITSLAIGTVETGKDILNFSKALVTGKSDDNSLGRMNDVGLKIGGIGIASYLASKRFTGTTKGMEFIGFGAFVAAMALWPKLVSIPMKIKHGFDIDQKYQDSQGRKKQFFLDNQYLPWDLWSKEKLNKVCEHNGVGKDVKDREEFIQKHMQKTALQGRTLATITAGLGVPLVTSMACNLTERGLEKWNVWHNFKLSKEDLLDIDNATQRMLNNPSFERGTTKAVGQILSEYEAAGLQPDTSFYRRLAETLNPLNAVRQNADGDSIKIIRGVGSADAVEKISHEIKEFCEAGMLARRLDTNTLTQGLMEATSGNLKIWEGFSPVNLTAERLKEILGDGNIGMTEAWKRLKNAGVNLEGIELEAEVKKLFSSSFEDVKNAVLGYASHAKESKARFKIVERAASALGGNQAESYHTRAYNNMSKEFARRLSPTKDELKLMMNGGESSIDSISAALQKIARLEGPTSSSVGSTGDYLIKKIGEQVSSLSDPRMKEAMAAIENNSMASPSASAPKFLQELGRKTSASIRQLLGVSQIEKQHVGLRVLMALDLERRLADPKYVEQYGDQAEQIIKTARKLIYEGTTGTISDVVTTAGGEKNYRTALKMLFEDALDEQFQAGFAKAKQEELLNVFNSAREKMLYIATRTEKANTEEAAAIMAEPITDFLKKGCKKMLNDKKWMKIFGVATVATIGVTLLAQLFLGSSKKELKLYQKEAKDGNK